MMLSFFSTKKNTPIKKPSTKVFFLMLGFLLLSISNTPLRAAVAKNARLYQVDIVIFQNKSASYLPPQAAYPLLNRSAFSSEVLLSPKQENAPDNNSTTDTDSPTETDSNPGYLASTELLSTDTSNNTDVQKKSSDLNLLLPKAQYPESFQLQSALEKLNSSGQYQVLYTASWISDFYYGKTKTFEFFSNKIYLWPTGSSTEQAYQENLNILNLAPLPLVSTVPSFPAINGSLSFSLGRYFDIKTKIQILKPDYKNQAPIKLYGSLENFDFTPLKVFHINQHVRTRSKKLIYIDSPSYGILMYLTPIEKIDTTQMSKGAVSNAN